MPDFNLTDVDCTQIQNTATDIDSSIEELSSICSVIENDVMVNLNPYWQGQAKQSFEEQFILFTESLLKLVDGYRGLNEQLKKAVITYGKADDSVVNLIAKLPK